MFILGETLALWALAGGTPGPAVRAGVTTPLVIAGLGLVGPIVGPRLRRVRDEAGTRRLPMAVDRALGWTVGVLIYGIPIGFVLALWVRAYV